MRAPSAPPPTAVAAGLVVGVLAVSTSSILIRVADAPALALSFWRCALGALALAPFALRARRGTPLDSAQRRQMLGAGALLAVHFAAFISALSYTTVASAAVLVTMAPLFVGIGAALFLSEPPSRRTWAGIAAAVAGAGVIALADAGGGTGDNPLLGDVLAFAGAAFVAGYLLLGRSARQRLPATRWAAGVYAVAAVVLLVWCVLAGVPLTGFSGGAWLAIGGLVVGPQLLGHTVFNALLSSVSATVVSVVVLAEPLGSTVLAAWLLRELPAPLFWAGAPLVIAGVFLAARGEPADELVAQGETPP